MLSAIGHARHACFASGANAQRTFICILQIIGDQSLSVRRAICGFKRNKLQDGIWTVETIGEDIGAQVVREASKTRII